MTDILDDFDENELSLLETFDHVLSRGLVISGQITISVAGVDLIYLGLNVLLSSVETIKEILLSREEAHAEISAIGSAANQLQKPE
ncbi:MAG: hypothetical protein DMF61_12235 [Blastocatellia bacterium AA13]|nr:MAG: hypothetical protein DMF61_12235 [Blastocatellia bacterium AA13]